MNEESQIALEGRIQDVLAGELSQRGVAELLATVSRDPEAREVLDEMLAMQRQCRRSIGCDVDEAEIQDSLAETLAAIRSTQAVPKPSRAPQRGLIARGAWAMRIAAVVVVAASVYLAVTAHNDSRGLRKQLVGIDERIDRISLREPTAKELMAMQRVWREVSQGAEGTRPWVYLSDGAGEFGYLPAGPPTTTDDGPVLLRCVIVGPDGRTARQMRLLLPPRQAVQLVFAEAGTLGKQPIHIAVSGSAERIGVEVRVGHDSTSAVGIRGRTTPGAGVVEAGRFRHLGRTMRVFLQAVALGKNVT